MVFCCVKQKRTGELCVGVIRAPGYTDNGFLSVLCAEDKGAVLDFPRCGGDKSRHHGIVMCLVFSARLFLVTSRPQSVRSLSIEDERSSVFVQRTVRHPYCLPTVPYWSNYICTLSSTHLQSLITSLYCLCQLKVLLRIHRIHTIMSSDRMSPTLPQINPQHPPAPIQLSPPVCVMSPHRVVVSVEPIGLLTVLQQGGNTLSPCSPPWPDKTELSSQFYHSCSIIWCFPPSDTSDLLGSESCPLQVAFGLCLITVWVIVVSVSHNSDARLGCQHNICCFPAPLPHIVCE